MENTDDINRFALRLEIFIRKTCFSFADGYEYYYKK